MLRNANDDIRLFTSWLAKGTAGTDPVATASITLLEHLIEQFRAAVGTSFGKRHRRGGRPACNRIRLGLRDGLGGDNGTSVDVGTKNRNESITRLAVERQCAASFGVGAT